jgi:prolyl 4-hydroxylase
MHNIYTSDRVIPVIASVAVPDVKILQGLLTDAECDELVELSKPKCAASTVVDRATGKMVTHEGRTSEGTNFQHDENPLMTRINALLVEVMQLPINHHEPMQILHYTVGGEYKPHFDYFPPEDEGSKPHIARGGNRVGTLIMYLNTCPLGGSTVFPSAGGLEVAAIKGNAVWFKYPTIDPYTLHGGNPVAAGEKWIATRWVREGIHR